MKTRTASCCCGDLTITVQGEPERVILCHCDYCQRRTGGISQVSCWFGGDAVVAREGEPRVFNEGPNNVGIDYCFCPRCGSTVYWKFSGLEKAFQAEVYGIAVGNFADPDFRKPEIEIFCRYRHRWVEPLAGIDRYEDAPPIERLLPKLP